MIPDKISPVYVDTFAAIADVYHVDVGDATVAKVPKEIVVATDGENHVDSADATAAKAYKDAVGAIVASYPGDCAGATVPKA